MDDAAVADAFSAAIGATGVIDQRHGQGHGAPRKFAAMDFGAASGAIKVFLAQPLL